MLVEALLIFTFTVAGAVSLGALGLTGWVLLPLGFVTGLAMFSVAGFAHAFLGTPVSPILPIVVLIAVAIGVWVYGRRAGTAVVPSLRLSSTSLIVLGGGVAFFWNAHLVKYHYDSLRYLMAGSLYHSGNLDSLSGNLLNKRFSAHTVIHSTGNFTDALYLRSVTPLLALAGLALLAWIVFEALGRQRSRALAVGAGALGILLLLTNRNFLWHSFYLNGHLFFAVWFMVAVGLGWLVASRPNLASSRALIAAQCFAIAGAVLARPEALFLVGTALAPLALSPRVSTGHKVVAMASFGLAVLLEQGFIARYTRIIGGNVSKDTVRLGLIGAAAVFFAALLLYRPLRELLERFHSWILGAAEIGLWLILARYVVRDLEAFEKTIDPLIENITTAAGGWGPAIVTLVPLVALAVWMKFPGEGFLRFPVTTFVPWILLFAYLREGDGYRLGLTDSGNRILMQIVLLAVLYVVAAAGLGRRRWKKQGGLEQEEARLTPSMQP